MNIRCISVEWKDSCLTVKSQITYRWKLRKGITVRQPKLSIFHFRGKNSFIYIPITPFPVGDKRTWNTKSELCSVPFSIQQCNSKETCTPGSWRLPQRIFTYKKESSMSFFGTLSHKWYMQKILYLFFPIQEFQCWTTMTNCLEKVWFISPSVKQFKANFLLSSELLELLH